VTDNLSYMNELLVTRNSLKSKNRNLNTTAWICWWL